MKEINDFDEDKTLSLWEDDSQKMMILADMHSGEQFSFMLKKNCIAGRRRPPSDLQITTQDRYISGSHVCFEKKGECSVHQGPEFQKWNLAEWTAHSFVCTCTSGRYFKSRQVRI